MQVKLNKIFEVEKAGISRKWKVIEHPYFPDNLTLVRDYFDMKNGTSEKDYTHMCGPVTLENAYEEAFKLS